ncbi:uncharacterized protein EAF02_010664 [Botrytis sinoallii]|uniref:uncharacterized protein n=1 Tax=Botrytis sinoallii TaxID=1463999 RepID=UPI001901919E|nr:uncharacterized protein EAF02_010664 [Botrytis sinoallii]KAF7861710.1 hypothetical protein EAF02_010664 [Botrytis sinoallii]
MANVKSNTIVDSMKKIRYLAVAQHKIGHSILEDSPTMMGRPFGKMYEAMAARLRGEDVDLNWD